MIRAVKAKKMRLRVNLINPSKAAILTGEKAVETVAIPQYKSTKM